MNRISAADVRWMACAALVVAALWVPNWAGFGVGTAIWIGIGIAMPVLWPARVSVAGVWKLPRYAIVAGAIAIGAGWIWLTFHTAARLMPGVFAGQPDVSRADMLPLINAAAARVADGHNPYSIAYAFPNNPRLPYGPILWLPHLFARWAHVDGRVFTLVGQLMVPMACGLAAFWSLGRREFWRIALLFAIAATICVEPEIVTFHVNGHTQTYWPLLLLLAVSLTREQWTLATILLALLVGARTTMIALVPTLAFALHARRALTWQRVAWFAVVLVLIFGPFVIDDPRGVWDGMYLNYVRTTKDLVWNSTHWAISSFGITGRLLARGWRGAVDVAQVVLMAGVYTLAWRRLRAGDRPAPWLIVTLLAFSMTTFWPVLYIYFDVWILAVASLLAILWPAPAPGRLRAGVRPALLVVVTAGVVLAAAAAHPGSKYTIDIGRPEANGFTGGGFGTDVSFSEGDRTFEWVHGPAATIRVPRASVFAGDIVIALRAYRPAPSLPPQVVEVMLNGKLLERRDVPAEWTDLRVHANARAWVYGFNVLELHFRYAVSAAEAGVGSDTEPYAAVIDRVAID